MVSIMLLIVVFSNLVVVFMLISVRVVVVNLCFGVSW